MLVRTIHTRHYDEFRQCFRSEACEASSDGGVSVFDSEGAEAGAGSLCQHIQQFYGGITGDPAIFWQFRADSLPDGCEIANEPVTGGDPCHVNIRRLSRRRARRFFKEYAASNFSAMTLCDPVAGARTLREDDLRALT